LPDFEITDGEDYAGREARLGKSFRVQVSHVLLNPEPIFKRPSDIQKKDLLEKVNLLEKFNLFSEHWQPKIIAELNGQAVKLAKIKGEFVWHHHENEDELFFVVKGTLTMKLRDRDVVLNDGEMFVVPRGVEHKPVCEEEVLLMLFEPTTTLNTGNLQIDRTLKMLEKI
jgi:mannose-6-phosphate isomerase-like protein (cupin superfamily)